MLFTNFESLHDEEKAIYVCQFEQSILTVIIGAKCIDGLVMVADKKVTDYLGNTRYYTNKIFADLEHILIGCGGGVDTFDIFRKYIVGDIWIWRDNKDNQYTFKNFIEKIKDSVLRFNKFVCKNNGYFEILVGKHGNTQNFIILIKMVKHKILLTISHLEAEKNS